MRLHAAHLPVARAAALLAALGGPVAAQEQAPAPTAPLVQAPHAAASGPPSPTASIIDGLIQVAGMPRHTSDVGADLCAVVRGDELGARAWSPETPQAASLFLWVERTDGSVQTGSGTIVAGSDAGAGNRVVSASHVFEDEDGRFIAKRVLAFGEDGVLLADLATVEYGGSDRVDNAQVVQEVRTDWAVLEPNAWFGVDAQAWNAMGAPLADHAPVDALLVAQPSGTAVIAPGASGSAVFDENGAIVGVVIQALASSEAERMGKRSPFADALFANATGDATFDAFVAFDRFKKQFGGMPEQVGNAGLAIPVLGRPRALLGAEEPVPLEVGPVFATITAFPAGECRTGAVVAYPRVESDRQLGRVNTDRIEAIDPARAWLMVQGLGWYPDDGVSRVRWQALRGVTADGHPVPAASVFALLEQAKAQEGRVGLEATRIEASLQLGLREAALAQARVGFENAQAQTLDRTHGAPRVHPTPRRTDPAMR